jgi:hypothetical protein
VQAVEQQRWALADLAASEPAGGLVDADGRGVLVEFDDDTFHAAQILGSCMTVEADAVADVEHRQRLGRVDRLQQLLAGVDCVGDRGQVRVKLAGGDLVKQ